MKKITKNIELIEVSDIEKMIKEAREEDDGDYLLEILLVVNKKIENCKKHFIEFTQKKYNAEQKHIRSIMPIVESKNTDEEDETVDITKIDKKTKEYDYYIKKYYDLFDRIDDILKNYRRFNKVKALNNIKYLLKIYSNVKIGMIEKEANVGIGYMSRLMKTDNLADPSIEFLATAADKLNIPLDRLVTIDLEREASRLSDTDKKAAKFLDIVYKETIRRSIKWFAYGKEITEPTLLNCSYKSTTDNTVKGFRSYFYNGGSWSMFDEGYECDLKVIPAKLFIIPIGYYYEEDDPSLEEMTEAYELYAIRDNKLIPLCSTEYMKSELSKRVVELYKLISSIDSKPRLRRDAKTFIDDYLSSNK